MVSVCTGLLGEEGRVSTSVDTRLLYKSNTFICKRYVKIIVRGLPLVTVHPPPPRAVPPWYGFVGRKVRIMNHDVNIA